MVEYALILNFAFKTLRVELWSFLERFRAIWTTAKMHLLVANLQPDRPPPWFLGQAGRADDEILCFVEASLRTCHEHIKASLTAESVVFTVVGVSN